MGEVTNQFGASRRGTARARRVALDARGLWLDLAADAPARVAGGGTLTDTLHIAWAGVTGLFFMFETGSGAAMLGSRFRLYSIVAMVIGLACGAMTGTYAAGIQGNLPTPGAGAWERVGVIAYMFWIAVPAIALLREPWRRAS